MANAAIPALPTLVLAAISLHNPAYAGFLDGFLPQVSTLLAASLGAGVLMFFSMRSRWVVASVCAILIQVFSVLLAAQATLISFFLVPFAVLGQSAPGVQVTGLGTLVFALSTLVNVFVLVWYVVLAMKNSSRTERAVRHSV